MQPIAYVAFLYVLLECVRFGYTVGWDLYLQACH